MATKLAAASFTFRAPPREQPVLQSEANGAELLMVLLGDFSGRTNRGRLEPLHTRNLVRIDTDNCERVFAQLDAGLTLSDLGPAFPEGATALTFHALEDFHPDSLLTKVPRLARLLEGRRLLQHPTTADRGRAVLEGMLDTASLSPEPTTPQTAPQPAPESDDATLARLLGGLPPEAPRAAVPASPAGQLIRQIVAPHITPGPAVWQAGALAATELELARGLNAILHHPAFQALEAAWRGVDWLVRRVESDAIKLCFVDVSLAELQADMRIDPIQSGLFGLLRDCQPSLLIGNYAFGRSCEELQTLTGLAHIAAQLRAPFIGTAAPPLLGCDSFAQTPDPDAWNQPLPAAAAEIWTALRDSSAAHYCGLAAPRFLARQPYGRQGDTIESFPFEEFSGARVHESFLWGGAGVLCAGAIIDGLQGGAGALSEIIGGEISELPVHKFTDDGEIAIQPYAEIWLADRAIEHMQQHGVTPLVGLKNSNSIRIPSLRSVAIAPKQLFG